MHKTAALSAASLSAALTAGLAAPAAASGFALNTQSAEALGAATAGAAATAATPANAYFNPASIVGINGLEGSFSMIGVINDSSYENAEGVLFGAVPVQGASAGEAVIGDGVFPTGAIATRLNDRLFAGLALYAPFGFNSSYDDDSIARYHGTFSQVVSGSVTPILGVSLAEGWSVAAGPRFQYVDVDIDGAIDAAGIEAALLMTASAPGTDDVFYELSANDWGVGYVAGLHGALTDRITFGVSFSSKIEHDLEGSARFDISQSAAGQTLATAAGLFQDTGIASEFTTPAILQIGAKVELTPQTRLLASAVQTRWSSFEQLTTAFDNPVQPPEVTTQNWKNAWSGSVGVEHDLSQSDTVRFGVMIEEDPVNPAFSTPRVPGASRVWLAAGYSRELSSRAELHLAASYVFGDTQPLDEFGAYPENLFRGSFEADVDITGVVLGVGLDWRF
jgi:long-chain fatty acid transport protein